jgi:mono/diheme cytochrome c family protein
MRRRVSRVPITMSTKSINKMRAHYLSLGRGVARFAAIAALSALALAGCSGGGAPTVENPVPPNQAPGTDYSGPAPASPEVQAFRVEFWQPALATAGCQGCHNAGGQAPTFLRTDDVNLAFQQANTVVNRETPALSVLVTKVAGGHNCWLPDPGACATILTRWITAWVGASSGGAKEIQLIEPTPVDPGGSKRLPATPPAAFRQLYNILDANCSGCHQPDSATAQSPFFAAGTQADANANSPVYVEAYLASIPKINLNDPAQSRFVIRVGREGHNCWTSSCTDDAKELLEAIQALANSIEADPTPPGMLSKALRLRDGTLASGGQRYEKNVIALYETGLGSTVFDTSGVAPAANLTLSGSDVAWVGGFGLNIRSGKAQASTTASRKLHQLITATGEYSIEAWVVPGNVTQEDARIISYSGSAGARNFTMGQDMYNYEFAARSSSTDGDGAPRLSTPDADEVLQASLQHVVMTFDPVNGRRIYVNAELVAEGGGGGTLDSWDNSFALVFGNEVSNNRQWQGVIRLAAIHNRALTVDQIRQNFDAGVGEKYFLLFGVSHLIDVPRAYIVFEAAEYDGASYLFNSPRFLSLDPDATPGNIRLKGMRIGVNGVESPVGQAYRLLDINITDELYSPGTGQLLSSVGTIIPRELGPESDMFYLCFDALGSETNACTSYTPGVAPPPVLAGPTSDIGVKLFDAINATMASITGVNPNTAAVRNAYTTMRQSLPATHDIQGFLSSHQTSVAQLALTYCDVLVDTPSLRSAFFPSNISFTDALTLPGHAAVNENGQRVLDVLYSKMIGSADTQPSKADFDEDMGDLIETLCNPTAGGATCTNDRTAEVIKAACGAALGNAATLIQ